MSNSQKACPVLVLTASAAAFEAGDGQPAGRPLFFDIPMMKISFKGIPKKLSATGNAEESVHAFKD